MGLAPFLCITACLLEITLGFVAPYSRGSASSGVTLPSAKPRMSPPIAPLPSAAKHFSSSSAMFGLKGFEFADLFFDDTSMAFDAWEWTANIGAPAALVAGAVLVTMSETREDLAPRKADIWWVRKAKMAMRFLLLSSFALEVVSIFVSTMTGSVLLGHGAAKKAAGYMAPLQLLHHHFEFEFLTTQVCFLQGLLNWLGAVAIDLAIPKESETKTAKRVNCCLASWLGTLIVWMLAFYNHHNTFYSDYFCMIKRLCFLFFKQYLGGEFRPLSLFYVPSLVFSSILTWRAFKSPPEQDED